MIDSETLTDNVGVRALWFFYFDAASSVCLSVSNVLSNELPTS